MIIRVDIDIIITSRLSFKLQKLTACTQVGNLGVIICNKLTWDLECFVRNT